MPDYSPMISAFMSGPNAQPGSEWRTAHPRIDSFLTQHPNFDFTKLGQGQFGGGRPGGMMGGPRPQLPGGYGMGASPFGDIPHTMAPPMLGGGGAFGAGGGMAGGGGFGPGSSGMPPAPRPMPPTGGGYDSSGITAGYNPTPAPKMMTNQGPGVGLAPDAARRPIPRLLK